MNTFHIGQRVRIVQTENYSYLLGLCATVVSELVPGRNPFTDEIWYGYQLEIDGFGTLAPSGYLYKAEPQQIEPITDRNEKVSWSTCAWKPEGVSA